MTYGLTPRMKDCLDFIDRHIAEHGYSPSFDEMKIGLGLTSKGPVHRLVQKLEERGAIKRMTGRSRSIVPVRAA